MSLYLLQDMFVLFQIKSFPNLIDPSWQVFSPNTCTTLNLVDSILVPNGVPREESSGNLEPIGTNPNNCLSWSPEFFPHNHVQTSETASHDEAPQARRQNTIRSFRVWLFWVYLTRFAGSWSWRGGLAIPFAVTHESVGNRFFRA